MNNSISANSVDTPVLKVAPIKPLSVSSFHEKKYVENHVIVKTDKSKLVSISNFRS